MGTVKLVEKRIIDRFLTKIVKVNDCWEWTGIQSKSGTPLFRVSKALQTTAARFSYEAYKGEVPAKRNGASIIKSCQNQKCVNPEHLFLSSEGFELFTDKRFWQNFNKLENGCWEWTKALTPSGYGKINDHINDKWLQTHRVSYELTYGPIRDGLFVCHKCDNPKCGNPDHLFLGTNTDNMRDASNKGRMAGQNSTHCKNGHEYTPENTLISKYGRTCRACRRNAMSRFMKRKS